jgi:AmmeMemoRadiSam system protein B
LSGVTASLVSSDKIFILGPSHHYHLKKCGLPSVQVYKTPVGDLKIDTEVVKNLAQTGSFENLSVSVDEAEHSIEMQLPFLAHCLQGNDNIRIIPIMVGSVNAEGHSKYASVETCVCTLLFKR